jgi:hypothetical protein
MNKAIFHALVALAWTSAGAGAPVLAGPPEGTEWIADERGCKVANPFPRRGETIIWSGECKDGFAHGEGVLQWFVNGREDDRYTGNLNMGWAEGHGVLVTPEGGKYDGQWMDSSQHGSGRYSAPDGSWYDGQWKMGKPHGHGRYRRPDGRIFTGEWIDGVYEGDLEPEEHDPNRT